VIVEVASLGVSITALILQRLEARKQDLQEPYDLRGALMDLRELLRDWAHQAASTNDAVKMWLEAGKPYEGEYVEYLKKRVSDQIHRPDKVLDLLQSEKQDRLRWIGHRSPDQRENLTHLLEVYAPELVDLFFATVDQRRELLSTIIEDLRRVGREPDGVVTGDGGMSEAEYIAKLSASAVSLNAAVMELTRYIRKVFPPAK
jgi:hypothetical protein